MGENRLENIIYETIYYGLDENDSSTIISILKKEITIISRTLIIFTFIIVMFFGYYFHSRIDIVLNYSLELKIVFILSGSWSIIGPLLIAKYASFEKLFLSKMELEENIIISINNKKQKLVKIIFILWALLISCLYFFSCDEFVKYGIYGIGDIYFWILWVYILFLLYLNAIGFSKVIFNIIYLVDELFLNEPLYTNANEKNEKFSFALDLFFKTTLYFSSGILFIPLLIELINDCGSSIKLLGYISIIIYSIILLFSFYFPKLYLKKIISIKKDKISNEKERIYKQNLDKYLLSTHSNQLMLLSKINLIYRDMIFFNKIEFDLEEKYKIRTIWIISSIPSIVAFLANLNSAISIFN